MSFRTPVNAFLSCAPNCRLSVRSAFLVAKKSFLVVSMTIFRWNSIYMNINFSRIAKKSDNKYPF